MFKNITAAEKQTIEDQNITEATMAAETATEHQ